MRALSALLAVALCLTALPSSVLCDSPYYYRVFNSSACSDLPNALILDAAVQSPPPYTGACATQTFPGEGGATYSLLHSALPSAVHSVFTLYQGTACTAATLYAIIRVDAAQAEPLTCVQGSVTAVVDRARNVSATIPVWASINTPPMPAPAPAPAGDGGDGGGSNVGLIVGVVAGLLLLVATGVGGGVYWRRHSAASGGGVAGGELMQGAGSFTTMA